MQGTSRWIGIWPTVPDKTACTSSPTIESAVYSDPSAALDVNLDVDVDRDVGKKDVPLQSDDDMPALLC